MAAYALIELEVTSMDGIGPYMAQVSDTVTKHGGKYLVRGGSTEVVEGGLRYPAKVVIEFPSMDAAKTWYFSAEYQAILPIRKAKSKGNFVWVEGA